MMQNSFVVIDHILNEACHLITINKYKNEKLVGKRCMDNGGCGEHCCLPTEMGTAHSLSRAFISQLIGEEASSKHFVRRILHRTNRNFPLMSRQKWASLSYDPSSVFLLPHLRMQSTSNSPFCHC